MYNKFETYVKMKRFYNLRFQLSTMFNYGLSVLGRHLDCGTEMFRDYSCVSITVLWW